MIRFEDHEKTLNCLAWKWNIRCPAIPFEDFISAGYEVYTKCANKHNKKRAKFNTYFYASCDRFFCGMVHRKALEPQMEVEEPNNTLTPEREVIFIDVLRNLPADAREVVELIFESPAVFEKYTLGEIRQYLRDVWSGDEIQSRISNVFAQIKTALKTL